MAWRVDAWVWVGHPALTVCLCRGVCVCVCAGVPASASLPQLKHRNIVQMIAFYNEEGNAVGRRCVGLRCGRCVSRLLSGRVWRTSDTFFLVSELMSGGELFEQIIQRVRMRV